MQICYTSQRTYPDPLRGSEVYIHDLARAFAGSDQVTVLATSGRQSRAVPGSDGDFGEVRTYPARDARWVGMGARYLMARDPTGRLRRWVARPAGGAVHAWCQGYWSVGLFEALRSDRPDIVHSQSVLNATTWLAWRATRQSRTPFVVTPAFHLADPDFDLGYPNRIVRDADAVIAQTPPERDRLLLAGVPAERLAIVPPGVDLVRWEPGSSQRFRTAHAVASDAFVILLPRKTAEKGLFDSLEALHLLAQQGCHPTAVILGTGPWPVQRAINLWIRRLAGEGTIVRDLGFLERPAFRDAIAGCDVVVEPSSADSFGMIYQDAWLEAKPVVAARIGAIPAVVQDGENGLLVPYGSSRHVADAIRLLQSQPSLARRLGERGRSDTYARYDLRRLVPEIRKVYELASARPRSRGSG